MIHYCRFPQEKTQDFDIEKYTAIIASTLVAARSVQGSDNHQSQAARRAVSTWMGARLANITRAVCTDTAFLQFPRAHGECSTV